jgi:AcrR family transcriptional regulator
VPDALDVKQPARERILDAAAEVLRTKGIANATTKELARAAGYSEAMLYKHFPDKQAIFLEVLLERLPRVHEPGVLEADADVRSTIEHIVEQFLEVFAQTFPMAASIFGSPELLREHRESVYAKGYGPQGPAQILSRYLDEQRAAGRISEGTDTVAVSQLLVGGAFHQAFLARFDGRETVPDAAQVAASLVGAVAASLGI